MAVTLKGVFDEYTDFTVDKAFARDVLRYVQGFINKNDVHTEAFGGALVGVKPVRYVTADANRWLEDILNIEEIKDCQQAIYEVEEINKDWHVSSDIVNLSFIYLVHRILKSKELRDQEREFLATQVLVMNMAKHLCSLLTHRFKFPSDPIVAQQLYESLDMKSHLKVHGSFLGMLTAHAQQVLDSEKGIHYTTLVKYDDSKAIIYAVNDIQNRLAKQINLLTEKYYEIKDSQDRILVKSTVQDLDGEKILREYSNKEKTLVRDMTAIVQDRRDFVRQELIDYTTDVIQTADERYVLKGLEYISDNFKTSDLYERAISALIIYMISEAKQGNLSLSDLPQVIGRLKRIMRSSRTKKKEALLIKQLFEEITEEAIPTARPAVKTSTQIAMIIYVGIRTLAVHKYR